jgi:syntaxin-binding protein 1
LSRFEPVLKDVLEEHILGRVPQDIFPYTKGSPEDPGAVDLTPASSLRSAKPTWAKSKLSSVEPRQRIIVFVAGGATYSEARACYEITEKTSRDVFLVTSHMMNPGLYLRQIGDLSQGRRNLRLPLDQPPPKAPAHLFEKPEPPKPAPPPANAKPGAPGARPSVPGGLPSRPGGSGAPPTAGMANMSLNSRPPGQPTPPVAGKLVKEEKEKKKKKHHFFSSSKS